MMDGLWPDRRLLCCAALLIFSDSVSRRRRLFWFSLYGEKFFSLVRLLFRLFFPLSFFVDSPKCRPSRLVSVRSREATRFFLPLSGLPLCGPLNQPVVELCVC